tara:strand:- start:1238 stop:1813 length:576 start_codon:yes stop_codon:yes gene_type:complete
MIKNNYIGFVIRLIIISTLSIGIAFILFCLPGCSKEPFQYNLGHDFEIDARLPLDSNGYYHLQLGQDWQTLHRISGSVSPVEDDWALTKVYWTSSHYWLINDTLGYIVHQNWTLNDNGYMYTTNDTSYVTWFEGYEVPTINETCYSTNDGEINIMFAPVQSMKGDTITVTGEAHFADNYISGINTIKIVVD